MLVLVRFLVLMLVFMPVPVLVFMLGPGPAFAVGQADESGHLGERDDTRRGGPALQRRGEEGFQILADPEHHGRFLARRRAGRLPADAVWRSSEERRVGSE